MQQATTSFKDRYKHRSYSQVRQLRTCGYQYKLQRIDKVPQRPGAANVAGTAVHTATEFIDTDLLMFGPPTEEGELDRLKEQAGAEAFKALDQELAHYAEKGWEEKDFRAYGFRPRQTVEWYRTTGIPNSISAYVDWRIGNPDFELVDVPNFGPAIEVPFNYYIEDQLVHGMIDRIFTSRERGGYYPFDLKSGKPPETDEQLGLYARALAKALGWNVEWGYYLYNLKKGEARLSRPLRLDHWTDDKLGQVYLPSTTLIDLGIFIPSPGENCQFCSVADDCPFAQSVV